MVLGQIGIAVGCKRLSPKLPLGWLGFAALFPDIMWPICVKASIETMDVSSQLTGTWPVVMDNLGFSHSLLSVVIGALAISWVYFQMKRKWDTVLLFFTSVLSWGVRLVFHRGDLPLFPWSDAGFGFGMWNSTNATLLIEFGIFFIGLLLYWWMTVAERLRFNRSFWAGMIVIAGVGLGSTITAPLTQNDAVNSAFFLWLAIPLLSWIDYRRPDSYNTL